MNELLRLAPEAWTAVTLDVSAEMSPRGMRTVGHAVSGPVGHVELVAPGDELKDLTGALLTLYQRYGPPWISNTAELRQLPDGDWQYTCDFSYSPPAGGLTPVPR